MSADETAQVLGALESINRRLAGHRATLAHFKRWSNRWPKGSAIRILDWGTGGADMPRALVDWGRRAGFKLSVVGVDNTPATIHYARAACRDYPEIEIREGDLESLSFPDASFDYAISSLTLHHLPDAVIVQLLQRSDRLVTRGIVMNDLIRSARAWAWIWAISRLFRMPSMVQHDGPLSVRRAFSRSELHRYALQAQLRYLDVTAYFGHRQTLAGEKI